MHPIDESKDAYLPSGVPMSLNLFESLKGDPVLQGVEPQLSAFRLSHTNPSDYGSKIGEQSLKVLSPIAFPAIPALSAKVRYSSSSAYMGRPTVIASLDIEAAPFFDNDVIISAIRMQLSEGIAKDLSTGSGVMLPMRCRPKDNTIFLFHLISADDSSHRSTTNPTSRTLEITISADVLVSNTCRPHIEMRWKTGVDFSIALNPSYGAPGQSLQRSKRPASLPMTPSTSSHGEIPTAQEGEHTGIISNQIRQRTLSVSDLSFTITFTSPSEVRVGEPFSCDMFIVNRSSKPRKLAVTVIPKRRRGEMKGHLSRPSASSIGSRRDTENTDAVIDENLLYAMQKNAGKEVPNIVSLSSDVKIGYVFTLFGYVFNAKKKWVKDFESRILPQCRPQVSTPSQRRSTN